VPDSTLKVAMPKSPVAAIPDSPSWLAESLRLTFFHRLGAQKEDKGWWMEVVGEEPETTNLKPREGGYEASGPVAGAVLTLKVDPLRIDWTLAPMVALDKPPSVMPTIGTLTDALPAFESLMAKWLAIAPAGNRIAFGATFFQSVVDRVAGYKLLAAYLPRIEIDPDHSSEFLYRINRHFKAANFGDIHVNRLATWGVRVFQPMMFQMELGPAAQGNIAAVGDAQHSLRLELDINTDATRKDVLPQAQFPALFAELVKLGKEFVAKGDNL
jgi:hypothetical protein